MCVSNCKDQKTVLEPPMANLQAVVSFLMRMLGTTLRIWKNSKCSHH